MKLRSARLKANISVQELTTRTNISKSDITDIEKGLRFPSDDQAKRIARILEIDAKELFPKILRRGHLINLEDKNGT